MLFFFRRIFGLGGAPPEPPVVAGQIMRPMKVREWDIDEALRLAFAKQLARQIAREDEELIAMMVAIL